VTARCREMDIVENEGKRILTGIRHRGRTVMSRRPNLEIVLVTRSGVTKKSIIYNSRRSGYFFPGVALRFDSLRRELSTSGIGVAVRPLTPRLGNSVTRHILPTQSG